MSDRKQSYQEGTIKLRERVNGPAVWELVYRRYEAGGRAVKTKEIFATKAECPTLAQARKSHKLAELRDRINGPQAVFFRDLAREYRTNHIIPKLRPHVARGYSAVLKYLEERWGDRRLHEMSARSQSVEDWLQGDLRSRRYPDRPLARATRQHLRNLLHHMFGYAIKRGYLPPGNPFDEVTTRGAGPRPVKRDFVFEPEMFDFLVNDPETAPHVRTMMIVAAGTGTRASEFLGMRWDDIEWESRKYGETLPVWEVKRGFDGRHEQLTKTDSSEGDALLFEPVVEALLRHREAQPSVNGWVFGSIRTGRPFHLSTLAEQLRPAFKRMGDHFGLEVPKGTGFHAFRHTLRGGVRDEGATLDVQQALMRHSGPAMTLRYQAASKMMKDQMRRTTQAAVVKMFPPRTGTDGD